LSDTVKLMEDLNQNFGCVLYQTQLAGGDKSLLQFRDIHDYALIYIDDHLIGTLDRRKNKFSLEIPKHNKNAKLSVLVEAVGRVNYGYAMHDRKGIHGPVYLVTGHTKTELKNWKNYPIQLGEHNIPVRYQPIIPQKPAAGFYKGTFTASNLSDTYIDMSKWNKGLVWINGTCLGRYWNIGPTQTMLVPGSWLKKGQNEIIVFDLFGTAAPALTFTDQPILDKVNETQPQVHKKAGQHWIKDAQEVYHAGSFENSASWQTTSFKPVEARFFCLEALSEQHGQPYTSVAELVLLDPQGKEIPRSDWKVVYADSEELDGDDGNAANVFDLQYTSIWHTEWQDKAPKPPHQIVIDLGKVYKVSGLKLFPRQDNANGRIKDYQLYFSVKPFKGI